MTYREIAAAAASECRDITYLNADWDVVHDLTPAGATDRILRAFVEMLREEAAHEEDVFAENAYDALADRIEKEIA